MGMPTTPAYIVMVALLVPALIKLGAIAAGRAHVRVLLRDPLGDHAAGGARRIRRGEPRQGEHVGSRDAPRCASAAPAYIVPFMFVYEPLLLLIVNDWSQGVGLRGVVDDHRVDRRGVPRRQPVRLAVHVGRLWHRVLLFIAALCLIKPGLITDAIGLVLLAVVVAAQLVTRRRAATAMP